MSQDTSPKTTYFLIQAQSDFFPEDNHIAGVLICKVEDGTETFTYHSNIATTETPKLLSSDTMTDIMHDIRRELVLNNFTLRPLSRNQINFFLLMGHIKGFYECSDFVSVD